MQTALKTTGTQTSAHLNKTIAKPVSHLWESLEFNRFGIIAILVVILGCIGGMAASFGALDNLFKLSLIAFPTIIALALILAVSPMRVIVYVSAIALALDLLVFIF